MFFVSVMNNMDMVQDTSRVIYPNMYNMTVLGRQKEKSCVHVCVCARPHTCVSSGNGRGPHPPPFAVEVGMVRLKISSAFKHLALQMLARKMFKSWIHFTPRCWTGVWVA